LGQNIDMNNYRAIRPIINLFNEWEEAAKKAKLDK
jgi:hypothetical protein